MLISSEIQHLDGVWSIPWDICFNWIWCRYLCLRLSTYYVSSMPAHMIRPIASSAIVLVTEFLMGNLDSCFYLIFQNAFFVAQISQAHSLALLRYMTPIWGATMVPPVGDSHRINNEYWLWLNVFSPISIIPQRGYHSVCLKHPEPNCICRPPPGCLGCLKMITRKIVGGFSHRKSGLSGDTKAVPAPSP